jgi:hypothetical protein
MHQQLYTQKYDTYTNFSGSVIAESREARAVAAKSKQDMQREHESTRLALARSNTLQKGLSAADRKELATCQVCTRSQIFSPSVLYIIHRPAILVDG